MANYLTMNEKQTVEGLIAQGWGNRKISRTLGIDKRTVARYRKALQNVPPPPPGSDIAEQNVPNPPPGSSGPASACEPFRALIEEKLASPQKQLKSIYYDLKYSHGFTGSYDSLKRFARRTRKAKPQVVTRLEFELGEAAQVDFGQGARTRHPKTGKYRKPWLFQMSLCASRKAYYEVVWDQSVDTFIACHRRAFAFFGGVPRTVISDNLKAAVIKAVWEEPELNLHYQLFSRHYGFVPLPCHVESPTEKGIVEAGVKYGQGILEGRTFESLEEQNRLLLEWEERVAGTRIHGTTKRQVNAMFAEEKPYLQPEPSTPFEIVRTYKRKVFIDATVEVKRTFYPVPDEYIDVEEVDVHVYEKTLRIYARGKEIAMHAIRPAGEKVRRQWPRAKEVPVSRKAWSEQLLGWAEKQDEATLAFARGVLESRPENGYRFLVALKAHRRKFGPLVFERAAREALERAIFHNEPFKLLCERIEAEQGLEQALTQENELIRAMEQYSLAFLQPQQQEETHE